MAGPTAMTNRWEQEAEKKLKKKWSDGEVTDWRLVIVAADMYWTGDSFTSSLWGAMHFQCMMDAREHFAQVERQGGTGLTVKRVRMFCADRNSKHVHPPGSP